MPQSTKAIHPASDLRIAVAQLLRRLREENSLPMSHAAVLARLERGGPRHTSGLASAERVRPQSMAQTIRELESERLVTRRPDPIDRRQILNEITENGRQALEQERSRRDDWLADAIQNQLDDDEQRILVEAIDLLRRLTKT